MEVSKYFALFSVLAKHLHLRFCVLFCMCEGRKQKNERRQKGNCLFDIVKYSLQIHGFHP